MSKGLSQQRESFLSTFSLSIKSIPDKLRPIGAYFHFNLTSVKVIFFVLRNRAKDTLVCLYYKQSCFCLSNLKTM
jgi:hypothetical protein